MSIPATLPALWTRALGFRRIALSYRAIAMTLEGFSVVTGVCIYAFSLFAAVWADGMANWVSGLEGQQQIYPGSGLTQVICAALAALVPICVTFINYLKARDSKLIADMTAEVSVLKTEKEANLGAIRSNETQLVAAQAKIKELTRLTAESARLHGEREETIGKIRSAESQIVAATAEGRAQEIAEMTAQIAALKAERDSYFAAAKAAESQLETANAWVKELTDLSAEADRARAEHDALTAQLKETEAKVAALEAK